MFEVIKDEENKTINILSYPDVCIFKPEESKIIIYKHNIYSAICLNGIDSLEKAKEQFNRVLNLNKYKLMELVNNV